MTNIQSGVDKTASELAIKRLKEEIEELYKLIIINKPVLKEVRKYFLYSIIGFCVGGLTIIPPLSFGYLFFIPSLIYLVFGFINKGENNEYKNNYLAYCEEILQIIIFKKEELAKHQKIVSS